MVFVDALRFVDAAIQARRVVLCKSDNGLDVDKYVECQAENRVWGLEMLVPGTCFVYLDDDEAGC